MTAKVKNTVLIVIGWMFVAIGIIGIVLPLLPTTVFLLIAAGCFAKGSPRFHDWLMTHDILGPPIHAWNAHQVVPRRAKILAVLMMSLSLLVMATLTAMPLYAVGLVATILGAVAAFLISCPSKVKTERV